jgi:putative oxidoreductase
MKRSGHFHLGTAAAVGVAALVATHFDAPTKARTLLPSTAVILAAWYEAASAAASARRGKTEREVPVMENNINNEVILAARLLLAVLFLIFGWRKLTDYSGTVKRMVQDGAPMPTLATAIAIFMELPVAFAVAVGTFTRLSAVLLALYTLGAALIAHRYWSVTGANKVDNMESFYKNLSIMGGLLLLYVTGAGKYSIDALFGL